MEYKIIMGVQPGYNVDNVAPLKAVKMAFTAKSAYLTFKDSTIAPIVVVYPQDHGAPKGGENGVLISGKTDEQTKIVMTAGKLMADLGQIDAAVLFFENGEYQGSSYIHNEFEKDKPLNSLSLVSREVYTSDENTKYHFDIVIDSDDMFETAKKLQDAENALAKDGDYIIVGILCVTDGKIHFTGCPDIHQGQNDLEKYKASLEKLVTLVNSD